MLDERTDENENQVVVVVFFFYDILGNSPIGQMDLNNHGSCLELQLYDLVKKKTTNNPALSWKVRKHF